MFGEGFGLLLVLDYNSLTPALKFFTIFNQKGYFLYLLCED